MRKAERNRLLLGDELEWFFDDIQIEGNRKEFEGSAINYKGDYDRRFFELLTNLGLHHPPFQNLTANNVYYLLGLLAFDPLQAIKLVYLPVEHQPKRVHTLLHLLLLIPKRHSRQLKAVCFIDAGWIEFLARPRAALPSAGLHLTRHPTTCSAQTRPEAHGLRHRLPKNSGNRRKNPRTRRREHRLLGSTPKSHSGYMVIPQKTSSPRETQSR